MYTGCQWSKVCFPAATLKCLPQFQSQSNNLDVLLYAPTLSRKFDPNLVVIFVIAVSNVFIGGYWGGYSKHKK